MNNPKLSNIIKFGNVTCDSNLEGDLEFYRKLSKEYLARHINNLYFKVNNIIDNEDVLADITTTLMMADWTFDKNKSSKKYWRIKCIVWQLNNIFKQNKHKTLSLLKEPSYNKTPESEYFRQELFQEIVDSMDSLSSRERSIMKDYYLNNLTQTKIAKKYELSQPRINAILEQNKKYMQEDLTYYFE